MKLLRRLPKANRCSPFLQDWQGRSTPSHSTFRAFSLIKRQVFLVLWPEPAGNVDENNRSEVTEGCSAILTYGHQGVAKPGTIKSEHAIAHTGRSPPSPSLAELPARGEQGMREPVRIDPFQKGDTLMPESRINFGKVYTIEHYVKVKSFGVCTSPAELEVKFDDVWNRRPRQAALPSQTQQRSQPSHGTYTTNLPPSARTNPVPNGQIARTPGSTPATSQRAVYRAASSNANGHQPRPATRSLSHGQATAASSLAAYRNVARRQHASSRRAIVVRNNSDSDSTDSFSPEEDSDE
nr:hypothetical protein CFP56_13395 [Quercus suber]